MEPFDKDELTDRELDCALKQWKAPETPARLRSAVFGERRAWWRRIWSASIRVPLPVACAIALVAVLIITKWPRSEAAPRVVVKTERVEVPVVQERVVYRDRPVPQPTAAWNPVAELRPRIIRGLNE